MARRKSIDSHTAEILRNFNLDPKECLWDCHGTWVLLHKWVVVIGQRAGIKLDPPQIVNADQSGRMGLVLVTGSLGDNTAWSFGEAAPYNNKNAYPFAMAEKRAKDRVILELVGLAGHVYTNQDVAEIKDGKPVWEVKEEPAKRDPQLAKEILQAIDQATSEYALEEVGSRISDGLSTGALTTDDRENLIPLFTAKRKELRGE